MTIRSPRIWWVAIVLLLWSPHAHCREFTHENIRDAMLSAVHLIRMSDDRLERHELREKALGVYVKKMLDNIDKKLGVLEPLKGRISRLDDRLSNVETILLQKEERERSSQNKINEALESIQRTLVTLIPKPKRSEDMENHMIVNAELQKKLDATNAKIDAVSKEIGNLKSTLNPESLRAVCLEVASDMNPFEKHISEAEKLLNKYELKLNEYNGTNAVQTDFVPLNEVAAADEAWHSKMSEVMERQEKDIKKIQNLLSDAESMWKDLPKLADLHRSTKQITEAISNATDTLVLNSGLDANNMVSKLREMGERLATTNEDVQKSLTQSNTMTERVYDDISRNYGSLRTEIQLLSRNDQQIVDISDNVLAIKKRLGIVVNQVIMELGEIIKGNHKKTNITVDLRLESMEKVITDNQTIALKNISSTLDSEMSQVWRQIGIMHQQIMKSQQGLEKLTDLSEQYVNSSSTTMNKVKKEVSSITTRVVDLGENLNYALGKLSVMVTEFERKTSGLIEILNKLPKNTTVAPSLKDAGPGPHKIASDEITT